MGRRWFALPLRLQYTVYRVQDLYTAPDLYPSERCGTKYPSHIKPSRVPGYTFFVRAGRGRLVCGPGSMEIEYIVCTRVPVSTKRMGNLKTGRRATGPPGSPRDRPRPARNGRAFAPQKVRWWLTS
eukprot:3114952-Rhodomonas_salina.4